LYLGAGAGVGVMYLFRFKREDRSERLKKNDLLYTIGMIVLDIAAPIFLMLGISLGSAANASLLGNFEIVATTIIALVIFEEKVSWKLRIAIGFITISSIVLSFEGTHSMKFSLGSLFVILATCCWGLENNCTRKISSKSTYEVVTIKGIFSGLGSFVIAIILGEAFPEIKYIAFAMILGFVAYGLSIFLYVRAQRDLGAARTSAYYAVAPFIGTLLAFLINKDGLSASYFIGLALMVIGTIYVICDTLEREHIHKHNHTIVHTHDGTTHTHHISHAHSHAHSIIKENHHHHHDDFMNSKEHRAAHAGEHFCEN